MLNYAVHYSLQTLLYTVQFTNYAVHYSLQTALYTEQFTNYAVHYSLKTVLYTVQVKTVLYIVQLTNCDVHCTVYSLRNLLYTVQFTTLCCTLYNLQTVLYTVQLTNYAVYFVYCTVQSQPENGEINVFCFCFFALVLFTTNSFIFLTYYNIFRDSVSNYRISDISLS